MNILKNKLLWIPPIALVLLLIILSIAFYPGYNPKPQNLPLAIVNLDEGTTVQGKTIDIGKDLENNLLKNKSDAIEWKSVSNEADARKALSEQKYYGIIVLEKDFSKHALSQTQATIMDAKQKELEDKVKSGEIPPQVAQQTAEKMKQSGQSDMKPQSAQLKTIISEGSGMQGPKIASKVFNDVGDNLNQKIIAQTIDILDQQNVDVPAKSISKISQPVKVESITIDKVKAHQVGGNAPFSMFMPVWTGSIISSALLFYAFRTSHLIQRKARVLAACIQIIGAIVTAFVGSFGYIYFMTGVQGFHFDHPNRVALFVGLAILGFIGLILGTMTWLGMKSVPIFFLLMFFSIQLVTLPKEMLPQFYRDYIVSWNPFSNYAETLRHIIYMNHSIELNGTLWMLIGFMLFGILSVIIAALVRKHSDKRTEIPA